MKTTPEEFKKYFKLVKSNRINIKVAAKACRYSVNHFRKLCKRYEKEDDKIFIHGSCGKPAHNAILQEVKNLSVSRYRTEYDEKTNPISFAYIYTTN